MCEHCGCRGVEPIAELMDEHYALLDEGHALRKAMAAGDRPAAVRLLTRLASHLDVHARREEDGVFAALRDKGEFLDEVDALERDHSAFDRVVAGLDLDTADFESVVADLLRDLDAHVERENLGIFPVSVVTLGEHGWNLVQQAREKHPTFLPGADSSDAPD